MIIFDLDGTLADCEHRRHFVKEPEKWAYRRMSIDYIEKYETEEWRKFKPDWDAFYEACHKDSPISPTLKIFRNHIYSDLVNIWSGRSESVREKTIKWFLDNWLIGSFEHATKMWLNKILKMRPIGDSTPDDVLKEKWLDEILAEGKEVEYVFDDRPKVVRMWRRRGIFVFDCNQNGEEF